MDAGRRAWEGRREAARRRFLLANGLFALTVVISSVGCFILLLSLPVEASWSGWGATLASLWLCLWTARWFWVQRRRFMEKVEILHRPTAAILLVTLATLPGRVLVLWQCYRGGLQWDLVGEGQVGNRILALLQAGVVVLDVATGTVENANTFLQFSADDLAEMACKLGDKVEVLTPVFAKRLRDEEALTLAMSPGWQRREQV